MTFTGSSLSVDSLRSYVQSRKEADLAEKRAQEAAAKEERDKLHESFETREVQPEAMDRIAAVVRRAIDMGEKRALVLRFPSDWLPDQGRAITNRAPDWYERLEGFPRRAYEFFARELEPRGFQLRAEIIDWPGGMPGDVGFYLEWRRPEEM